MDPRIRKLLDSAGIASSPATRGQMDTTGYAVRAEVLREIVRQAAERVGSDIDSIPEPTGAICPHDDFVYAARLYHLALSRVTAPRVVLFGVAHHARVFGFRDTLIFDAFQQWRTPLGPVPVSGIRDDLLQTLPAEMVTISSDGHAVEHSLEGIVQYLRALHPDVEIVPVLVPFMTWDRLEDIAEALAAVFAGLMRERSWVPGRDIAWVMSNDGVHYGDAGWGGGGYAPFGCDVQGYIRAVEQDMAIVADTLTGTVHPDTIRAFFSRCCDPDDPAKYRVTWCGRFAVSLGLSMLTRLGKTGGFGIPAGRSLGYGTSVSEISLDLDRLDGLGTTAPNHFHHFVGYPAIGYRMERNEWTGKHLSVT